VEDEKGKVSRLKGNGQKAVGRRQKSEGRRQLAEGSRRIYDSVKSLEVKETYFMGQVVRSMILRDSPR